MYLMFIARLKCRTKDQSRNYSGKAEDIQLFYESEHICAFAVPVTFEIFELHIVQTETAYFIVHIVSGISVNINNGSKCLITNSAKVNYFQIQICYN